MKIKKKEKKDKTFTLRLETRVIAALEKIAASNDCTVSEVIRQIVDLVIKSPHEDKLPIR